VVSQVSSEWALLESAFEKPVNFLITHVYDDGIAKLWDAVVHAVHLDTLKLPVISGLAGGGVIPGYAPGHDSVPAMLSPGEAVLTPGATRAIGGAGTVNALNAAYAPPSGSRAPGHFSFGGIGSMIGSLVSGGEGVGKAVIALTTGNTTAFVNALSGTIGTSAAGELGQVMVAMPKTLLTDAAKKAMSMLTGGGSGGAAATPANVASWMKAGTSAAGVPASWIPDLEIIAQHESSDSPTAVNNWDSNAAAGNNSRGLMQLIPGTFAQYHVPGTSMNIFDPVANIAASIGYIRARYGTVGQVPGIVSLNQGGQYVGYDSGGWLPPGMTAAVNMTGKPEAVLTAEQSQALSRLASGQGAQAAAAPQVNVNYYGPQEPSPEQRAIIMRDMSLMLSGG
jgi:SLT domain-containing protein